MNYLNPDSILYLSIIFEKFFRVILMYMNLLVLYVIPMMSYYLNIIISNGEYIK